MSTTKWLRTLSVCNNRKQWCRLIVPHADIQYNFLPVFIMNFLWIAEWWAEGFCGRSSSAEVGSICGTWAPVTILGLKRNIHVYWQWERNLEILLVELNVGALECPAQELRLNSKGWLHSIELRYKRLQDIWGRLKWQL